MTILGFQVPLSVVVLGVITGMTYGVLGVGLVIVFRANRVLNFAHGAIGALGASVLGLLVLRWHVPYLIGFVAAIATSSLAAAVSELVVIRRLRRSPSIMSVIATLGIAQVVIIFAFSASSAVAQTALYPEPPGFPQFSVGPLLVVPAYGAMLLATPVVLIALALFLRRSRFGVAIRASVANPNAARAAGVYVGRMSTLSWVLAGAMAAYGSVLIFPTQGHPNPKTFGPTLLLLALIPAVVGRMESIPKTLVAGIVLGVVEEALYWNYPSGGRVQAILFVIVLLVLLVQHRRRGRTEVRPEVWVTVLPWPPLPDSLRRIWRIRNLGWIMAWTSLVVSLLVAAVIGQAAAVTLASIAAFALVGLSVLLISGLAGQLSLGQFAIAGVGATGAFIVQQHTGNVFLGLGGAVVTGAAASWLIGLPALRIPGLMLTATTLAFALAAQDWLFLQPWMMGSGRTVSAATVGPLSINSGRSDLVFSIVVLAVGMWVMRNVWQGGFGRRLRAVRDNDHAARAFTMNPMRVKMQAFLLAGMLAGIGGAVYAYILTDITPQSFTSSTSIDAVALTVLGGIGMLAGPILGAFYIIGIPRFVPLNSAVLAASSLGWLLLIIYMPGGFARLAAPLRSRLIGWLAKAGGGEGFTSLEATHKSNGAVRSAVPSTVSRHAGEMVKMTSGDTGTVASRGGLEVRELKKTYGGIVAVDHVSFAIEAGECVGLIGPNGAGKTTLFEMISGFTEPDGGKVLLDGRDLSKVPTFTRARLGLIRSFQDASLFATLTVQETVELSLEKSMPTRCAASVIGVDWRSRRKRTDRAREVLDMMGLGTYSTTRVSEISTGTRRIVELSCMVALQPSVLLLDEPSAGIAQSETGALRELLLAIHETLGVTLVVIEHDISLIMAISDRIVAMELGRIIADGNPKAVREDPRVIESYLGGMTEGVAARRSDPVPAPLGTSESGGS